MLKLLLITTAIFFLGFSHIAYSQTQQNQIQQPVFLPANEEVKEICKDNIYLSQKRGEKRRLVVFGHVTYEEEPTTETRKLYFTDGQGKVLNCFNVFPNPNVLGCASNLYCSKKYLVLSRSFVDGKNEVSDGFVFDNKGTVLWHVPKKDFFGYIFPNDKTDSLLRVDIWSAGLKIFTTNGIKKGEKCFSSQRLTESEDTNLRGNCASSEDGNYIAVARSVIDKESSFESELSLLDSTGKVIFQNKDKHFYFWSVLKVYESPRVIVVEGNNILIPGEYSQGTNEYFGFDFNGKLLWKLDGEKYAIQPSSFKSPIVKLSLWNKPENTINSSELTINVATGEVK